VKISYKRVFVTGAGGFIGSHVAERLAECGAEVLACVRSNSRNHLGFLEDIADGERIRVCIADVRDLQALSRAMAGADAVLHLAAQISIPYSFEHPYEVAETNTLGSLNVLMAAKSNHLQRVVLTSTSEVYGTAQYVPIDERHPKHAQSPYAASKIAADAFATSFHLSGDLPVVILRPFNTYGPRQSDRAIIPALIAQALTRDEVEVGNTAATRDFTYVSDTVEGFLCALRCEAAVGREINLGTGADISIAELAQKIIHLVGRDNCWKSVACRQRPAASEVRRLVSDNRLAREILGWSPRVSLDEGLEKTIAWVQQSLALYHPESYVI
jgi:dTDP-glucose 4,6-dehydratase